MIFELESILSVGLIPELICTIEFKKLQRIRTVDISGGKPGIIKRFRIAGTKTLKLGNNR